MSKREMLTAVTIGFQVVLLLGAIALWWGPGRGARRHFAGVMMSGGTLVLVCSPLLIEWFSGTTTGLLMIAGVLAVWYGLRLERVG